MKRSIALLLTVIMVIGMIPASLLPAIAHGIGVGMNDIDNLSIDNAPNQAVPATVSVDGVADDTAWAYEDWNKVDSATGLWDVTTAKNPNFNYKYQLHTDYEYLYGVFVIDASSVYSGEVGDITVWINDGTEEGEESTYTSKVVLSPVKTNDAITDFACTVYDNAGTEVTHDVDNKTVVAIDAILDASVITEDRYTIEFRTLIKDVAKDVNSTLTSYVSVDVNKETLWYPPLAETGATDTMVDPLEKWPDNAIEITQWEILSSSDNGYYGTANGDFSEIAPSEIQIDGEFTEGIWSNLTSKYSYNGSSYDYRENGIDYLDLTVGYSKTFYQYKFDDGFINLDTSYEDSSGNQVQTKIEPDNVPLYENDSNTEITNKTIQSHTVSYSNYEKWAWDPIYIGWDGSPVKFKYDVRADADYFYGAVVLYADCEDTDFYYYLDVIGEYLEVGETMVVPTYMYLPMSCYIMQNGKPSSATTLQVGYNTEVRKTEDGWEFTDVHGEGHNEIFQCKLSTEEKNNWVSAKRVNRQIINFEFAIPLTEIGLKDKDTGKFIDVDEKGNLLGTYNSEKFDIRYTIIINNTSGTYNTMVDDNGAYAKKYYIDIEGLQEAGYVTTDSEGKKTLNGFFQDVKYTYDPNQDGYGVRYSGSGDTGTFKLCTHGNVKDSTGAKEKGDNGTDITNMWNKVGDNPNVYQTLAFGSNGSLEAGHYAYHVWSNGSGMTAHPAVKASNEIVADLGASVAVDGELEDIWANLQAADARVNGMARDTSKGKHYNSATDKVVTTFYHELAMDSDYLYGAALILDGDGSWDSSEAFRLWINTGAGVFDESWNYVVDFQVTDAGVPYCIGRENDGNSSIVFRSDSYYENTPDKATNKDNLVRVMGYGIEVAMKTVENYPIRDIINASTTEPQLTNLYVLEFRVPLELIDVDSVECHEEAFQYAASFGGIGQNNQQNALMWPWVDNDNLEGSTVLGETEINDNQFYLNPWNSENFGQGVMWLDDRRANTITIDGAPNEEFWNNEEERISVDTSTGTWGISGKGDFDYSYKVYTGREHIYGAAIVNGEMAPGDKFTLYATCHVGTATTADHVFQFYLDEYGEAHCIKIHNTGAAAAPTFESLELTFTKDYKSTGADSTKTFEAVTGGVGMKVVNGKTYIEFKIDLESLGAEFDDVYHFANWYKDKTSESFRDRTYYYEYCVGVTIGDNTLYHPDNSDIVDIGGSTTVAEDDRETWNSTETLWVTGYNSEHITAGTIITDKDKVDSIDTSIYITYAFAPTEYEDIYEITARVNSGSSAVAPELPENGFIYVITSSPIREVNGVTNATNNYNCWSSRKLWDAYDIAKADADGKCYVRLTGIDLEGETVNAVYGDRWREDLAFTQYGYGTDATYTVVNLGEERSLATPDNVWGDNALTIEFVDYYIPETIDMDGEVNDTGWDENRWIEVVDNANGNLQNESYYGCSELDYKYQIRVDDKYVYVAAVMNANPDEGTYFQYTNKNGVVKINPDDSQSVPYFRIWIQSQNEKYKDAVSFTHLFDVRPGETTISVADNALKEITDHYESMYHPVDGVADTYIPAEDAYVTLNNGDDTTQVPTEITFNEAILRAAEHLTFKKPNGGNADLKTGEETVNELQYGETAFYGETTIDAENTLSGYGVAYQAEWYARPDVQSYVYGNDHAIYKTSEDGRSMTVEFKFALEDIGCENGEAFEYYVQGSSYGISTTHSYSLYHPALVIESCNEPGEYVNYYLPFWVWGNTAAVIDTDARADLALRHPTEPVTPIGTQYHENYNDSGNKAIRFGVLYNANYLYAAHDDNATYWDSKEIGMIYRLSRLLSLDESTNETQLYTETKNVTYIESDAILNWQPGTCMADYENYIFYAILQIPESQVETKITYRGFVEYYPSDDIYYDHWWLWGGTPEEDPEGSFTYRPTYYSDPLTRSYNMISTAVNNTENGNLPDADDYIVEEEPAVTNENGINVVYVPLDNRPVNLDRVQDLAASVGINLIVPDENMISTTLYPTGGEDISDQGNCLELLSWLKEQETEANYFVLSLDQMFSGGLVGSRDPYSDRNSNTLNPDTDGKNENGEFIGSDSLASEIIYNQLSDKENGEGYSAGDYVLSADEKMVADYIKTLSQTNHVVCFDTVMRLAATQNYGMLGDLYDDFRGYSSVAREQFYNADLTIDNIIANYTKDANGETIGTVDDDGTVSGSVVIDGELKNYSMTNVEMEYYLVARERKLKIAEYLYGAVDNISTYYEGEVATTVNNLNADADMAALFIGVDDSEPDTNVQTNEMRYITERLITDCDTSSLFAGADELGMMAVTSIVTSLYGKITVNVEYFGKGQYLMADSYDPGTLDNNIKSHVWAAGGVYNNLAETELDILVLTRPDYNSITPTTYKGTGNAAETEHNKNVAALVERVKENQKNGILTCVVDGSGYAGYGVLAEALLSDNEIEIAQLMGYSSWNTTGNATGIALGNAIARTTYILNNGVNRNAADAEAEAKFVAADEAFLKAIGYAFIKDIAYKNQGQFDLTNDNFKAKLDAFWLKATNISNEINASKIWVSKDGGGLELKDVGNIYAHGLYWPWDRPFEANFTVDIVSNDQNPTCGTYGSVSKNCTYTAPKQGKVVKDEATGAYLYVEDDSGEIHYPDEKGTSLTDAVGYTTESYTHEIWAGFHTGGSHYQTNGYFAISVDLATKEGESLNRKADIYSIDLYAGNDKIGGGIYLPKSVEYFVSYDNGANWVSVGTVTPVLDSDETVTCQKISLELDRCLTGVTNIEVRITPNKNWVFVSEISANGITVYTN